MLTKRAFHFLTKTLSSFSSFSSLASPTSAFSSTSAPALAIAKQSLQHSPLAVPSCASSVRTFTTTTTLTMSSSSDPPAKPTIPADYVVPKVWKYKAETMKPVHKSNVPTSGAQTDKELPKGKHDIQLYGLATPNGMKVSIMLEELVDLYPDFEYDAYLINIMEGDQFTSGFCAVNPNSKIPAIFDQSNGARVFESGAILVYLAEKYKAFLPSDPVLKAECMSWVFFQVGAGPYYGGGGLNHFKNSAPLQWEYAIDRYTIETKRILNVLEKQLANGQDYLVGDEYTIADMAHWRWTTSLIGQEYLDGPSYKHLQAWSERIAKRPAVERGARVLGWGEGAIKERHSRADTAK